MAAGMVDGMDGMVGNYLLINVVKLFIPCPLPPPDPPPGLAALPRPDMVVHGDAADLSKNARGCCGFASVNSVGCSQPRNEVSNERRNTCSIQLSAM